MNGDTRAPHDLPFCPDVDERLDRGEVLHMSFGAKGRMWWFSGCPGLVDPDRAKALGNRMVESGDSLFGWPGFSQTWRMARD